MLYIPHVAKGMVIKAGRYISPPDIEAQLAPDNYLYTHSLMFTVDCYTQTGVSAAIKLNDQWSVLFGIPCRGRHRAMECRRPSHRHGHGSVGLKK